MSRKTSPYAPKAAARQRLSQRFQDFLQEAFVPTSAEWFIAGDILGAVAIPLEADPEEKASSGKRPAPVNGRSAAA